MRSCPISFHSLTVGDLYEMAEDGQGFKRGDVVELVDKIPGGPGRVGSEIRLRAIETGRTFVVSGASWLRPTGTAKIVRDYVVDVEGFGLVAHGDRVRATSPEEAIAKVYERHGIKAEIRSSREVAS